MKTEITEKTRNKRGEIFYDAECPLCLRGFRWFGDFFTRHGFHWLPLQTPGLAERLRVDEAELRREMKVLCPDGRLLGGIDTWSYLLRSVWWLWPLGVVLRIPGIHAVADGIYRWLARNRYCLGGRCQLPAEKRFGRVELMLCAAFPATVGLLTWPLDAWVFMWTLAIAMGLAGKWITFRDALHRGGQFTFLRLVIWFFAWPGLDGRTFFDAKRRPKKPAIEEWIFAISKAVIGFYAFRFAAPHFLLGGQPLLAGWIAMVGLILFLHFGLLHLLSILWRACGIEALPIMRTPLLSRSLAEFWGTRWNTAFSIPARRLVLMPLARKIGTEKAAFVVFLLSGLLHELVITVPARGGFGLPTLYFTLQGLGTLIQGSRIGQNHRLDRGWRGRLFTLSVTGLPLCGLFPPVFVHNVILPMLNALSAN